MHILWGVALALAAVILSPVIAHSAEPNGRPAHIATVHEFLLAWGHERWDDLRDVSADTVTVRAGDHVVTVQPATRKSDATIAFPFRGLSTVRAGEEVKGVAIEELVLRVGTKEMRGPATVTLQNSDGRYRVVGVSLAAPH